MKNKVDINICYFLYKICEYGYVEILNLLLNNGVDIDVRNEYGMSFLYVVCEEGFINIV